jgi:arylsulfatase
MAAITEAASGFYGASGRLSAQCATIAEILQEGGWSTFWLGKDHNVLEQDVALGASRKEWPLQKSFGRVYGFLGGETSPWYSDLVEDNRFTEQPYSLENGCQVPKDIADQTMKMMRDQKASNPSKPSYMWFCPGADHASHHAPAERNLGLAEVHYNRGQWNRTWRYVHRGCSLGGTPDQAFIDPLRSEMRPPRSANTREHSK